MYHISRKIHEHIINTDNFLIIPHQNPDGDALGSVGAIAQYLKQLNKNVKIFCATSFSNQLNYLPNIHLIHTDPGLFTDENINTIIVVDSGDLAYAGIDKLIQKHHTTIINIDHHYTNQEYGQYNLINKQASSTTEVIYTYFKANQIHMDKDMATALLTGIVTDTGNFTNSATSVSAINIAGHLLTKGANLNLINRKTLQNNTINILKLWGIVLDRLEYHAKKDVAYTYLTQKDLNKYGTDEKEAEGISNFMNTIGGVKIGLFLKETQDGKIKGSLRTTEDNIDVSAIAQKMGGGGHKKAAGFTVEGSIQGVLDIVLTIIQ